MSSPICIVPACKKLADCEVRFRDYIYGPFCKCCGEAVMGGIALAGDWSKEAPTAVPINSFESYLVKAAFREGLSFDV